MKLDLVTILLHIVQVKRTPQVGSKPLKGFTSGYHNVAVGYQSLTSTTTGHNNVAVGYGALDSLTTGDKYNHW